MTEEKPINPGTLAELTLKTIEPKTEAEKELATQIQEIKDKGRIVEIPNEIF